MSSSKFSKAKKNVEKSIRHGIFVISIGVFFLLFFIRGAFSNLKILYLLFIPAIFIVVPLISISDDKRLLKQLSHVLKIERAYKTYEIKLTAPTAVLLTVSQLRRPSPAAFYPPCYGAILKCKSGKKYYLFFNDNLIVYDKTVIKQITDKLTGDLTVRCYENTCVIQSIERDPNFINIGNGHYKK